MNASTISHIFFGTIDEISDVTRFVSPGLGRISDIPDARTASNGLFFLSSWTAASENCRTINRLVLKTAFSISSSIFFAVSRSSAHPS